MALTKVVCYSTSTGKSYVGKSNQTVVSFLNKELTGSQTAVFGGDMLVNLSALEKVSPGVYRLKKQRVED